MFITALIVLVFLAFARSVAISLIMLVWIAGATVAAVLLGGGVTNLRLTENDKGSAGAQVTHEGGTSHRLLDLAGWLTAPLLGLAGANLLLEGLAWSLLWVVLVLLFVAFLKTTDMFTTVVLLLLGGAIGWAVTVGGRDWQEGIAVALVWLLLIGGVVRLAAASGLIAEVKFGKPGEKDTVTVKSNLIVLAIVWVVSIIALWLGVRRLVGI